MYALLWEGFCMEIEEAIGMRIRELRWELRETQEMFCNRIGLSRTYFAEIEGGRRNVSIRTLRRIFEGLGVSPAEFFDSPLFR